LACCVAPSWLVRRHAVTSVDFRLEPGVSDPLTACRRPVRTYPRSLRSGLNSESQGGFSFL
jgi:hypothetical protein